MKLKKKTLKIGFGVVVLVLVLFFVLKLISAPSYPDVETPKAYLGNSDASVQLIEFSDLQCPFCAKAHDVLHQIVDEYGDKIGVRFYYFPLSIHEFAFDLAMAAECANDQGKFWDYLDVAFGSQAGMNHDKVIAIGDEIGLDMDSFKDCIALESKKKFVEADYQLGLVKGVSGTPSFFINDKKMESWQYDSLKKEIDALLDE